jgi:hypothetical protein
VQIPAQALRHEQSRSRPLSPLAALGDRLGGSSCKGGSEPQPSALNVQVLGLPSNADANVTVSFGGVSQLVTPSQTLVLAPAEPVLTGQFVMSPTAATQTVTVALGQIASVTVSYNTLRALALKLEEDSRQWRRRSPRP